VTNLLFVAALLCFLDCEATLIRGFWFRTGASGDLLDSIGVPFMVLSPALMGLAMRFVVGKFRKIGQISPSAAGSILFFLGLLMMLTYLMAMNLKNLTIR
jgi:hypothetical protein